MKNSTHPDAEQCLIRAYAQLSEEFLRHHIDAPVDQRVASFQPRQSPPMLPSALHEFLIEFVRHVHGATNEDELSPWEALADGMDYLERGFTYGDSRGYMGACLAVASTDDRVMDDLLACLIGMAKETARRRHVDRVLQREVMDIGFGLKVAMAAVLLTAKPDLTGSEIELSDPIHLAVHLPTLIMADLQSSRLTADVARPNRFSPYHCNQPMDSATFSGEAQDLRERQYEAYDTRQTQAVQAVFHGAH